MPTPIADPQRVAVYIRTTRTDPGGHGFSVYSQRLAINHYIMAHGLALVAEYIDESGATAHRPQWHRLIAAAQADRFDALLVLHAARISRDAFVVNHYMKYLGSLGIAVTPVTTVDQLPEIVEEVRGWFVVQEALRDLEDAEERLAAIKQAAGSVVR